MLPRWNLTILSPPTDTPAPLPGKHAPLPWVPGPCSLPLGALQSPSEDPSFSLARPSATRRQGPRLAHGQLLARSTGSGGGEVQHVLNKGMTKRVGSVGTGLGKKGRQGRGADTLDWERSENRRIQGAARCRAWNLRCLSAKLFLVFLCVKYH